MNRMERVALDGRPVPGFALGQQEPLTSEEPDWPNLRAAAVYWWDGAKWNDSGLVGQDPTNVQLRALLSENAEYFRWAWIMLDTSQQACGVMFPPGVTALVRSTIVFDACMTPS